jgi:hypothetical protein
MPHNLGHFVTRGENLREFGAMSRPNAYREVNTTIHLFSAVRGGTPCRFYRLRTHRAATGQSRVSERFAA